MILSMAPVLLAAMAVADPLCYWKENGFPELVFQKLSCALCYHYMHYSNFVPGTKAPQRAAVGAPGRGTAGPAGHRHRLRLRKNCRVRRTFGSAPQNLTVHVLKVKKYCGAEGIWFGHPTNLTVQWTDYSTCSLHGVMEHRLYIGVITHIISTVLLLPALVIFSVYRRQLHGQRILLHKNLFASLLFNAVFEICFKTGILLTANEHDQDSVLKQNVAIDACVVVPLQNAVHCRLLLMLIKYFRLTNYIWMFCEGFYLHRMIAAAFPEEWNPRLFYVIGWGFPLLPALVYAVLRVSYFDENCWILPADTIEWVLNAPSLFSLIVSLDGRFVHDVTSRKSKRLFSCGHYSHFSHEVKGPASSGLRPIQQGSEGRSRAGAPVWASLRHHGLQAADGVVSVARSVHLPQHSARWSPGGNRLAHILLHQRRSTGFDAQILPELYGAEKSGLLQHSPIRGLQHNNYNAHSFVIANLRKV
ncbi:hypothetical protein C0J52_05045 [Blattella germanica]|nr:hypothetical protein C0J52_05045 [Blattella germanica]